MADDIKCTLRKSDPLDDWYVLEREQHAGIEQIRNGALYCSGRITDADIEGTAEEWASIADGIEKKSARISFKRVAMHTNEDATIAIWSPRNSSYDAELTADAAAHLAREIRKTLAECAP